MENKGGAEDEERENPNRKSIHAVRKEECRAKNERGLSKNRPKSAPKRGKTRKKWASQGKKTSAVSRKIVRSRTQNEARREKSGLHRVKNESGSSKNRPKSDLKRGKAGKTEIWERKRWGGGSSEKMGFTTDFAML